MTGTFWHRYVEKLLQEQGVKTHTEIKCDPGLPDGWSGTADWLFWHPEHEAWVLGDLKTTKGEGLKWVHKDGAKLEHLWQLSAYFWALVDMGFPMLNGFGVLYLPMNDVPNEVIEPTLQECDPLDREIVFGQMQARWKLTAQYLNAVNEYATNDYFHGDAQNLNEPRMEAFLNEHLAAEQDREQNVYWNKSRGTFEVKLVPHWSAQFCPFPDDLCACNQQGTTKIGEYEVGECEHPGELYVPRKGYEDVFPTALPDARDYVKRRKELEAERIAREAA